MADFYRQIIRVFWLGGLWSAAYVVRPVLAKAGFFPMHGMEVIHWVVGLGVVAALLSISLVWVEGSLIWKDREGHILVIMLTLSLAYFGLLPWWKLQMIVVHALSLLGLLWLWLGTRKAT